MNNYREWAKTVWTDTSMRVMGLGLRAAVLEAPPFEVPDFGIGIDPGRNFGLAVVSPKGGSLIVYYGYCHLSPNDDYATDGWTAFRLVEELLSTSPRALDAAVEGAAHSENVGQANLAYIREGFFLGLTASGHFAKMVAPNTARKSATGNGRVSMGDLLPTMNGNAADALGCALHASGYRADAIPTL